METIRFDDRVALVTGGGRGLGRTYALELARRGCRVVVNDPGGSRDGRGNDAAVAHQVAEEIRAAGGQAVADFHAVNTAEGGAGAVETAIEAYGRLDILIHNAGILRDRSFAKMTEEEWRSVLSVHLDGAYYTAKPAWTHMRKQVYGRVVFTTSVSGLFGNFGQGNYGAAKLGLVGLMNTLVVEGAKYKIHVNAVSPIALTRMTEDLVRSDWPDVSRDPEHVTPAVLYLCTEQCDASGMIIQAGQGFFGRIQVAFNPGRFLGREPVGLEELAENWDGITDVSELRLQTPEERYVQYVYRMAGV